MLRKLHLGTSFSNYRYSKTKILKQGEKHTYRETKIIIIYNDFIEAVQIREWGKLLKCWEENRNTIPEFNNPQKSIYKSEEEINFHRQTFEEICYQ